jgi:hypothetical protein
VSGGVHLRGRGDGGVLGCMDGLNVDCGRGAEALAQGA